MICLVLLTCFNVLSGEAFCFSSQVLDSNPYGSHYVQENQNSKGIVFEGAFSVDSLQHTSNDFDSNGKTASKFISADIFFKPGLKSQKSSDQLLDKRRTIEHQIFPFHFFW